MFSIAHSLYRIKPVPSALACAILCAGVHAAISVNAAQSPHPSDCGNLLVASGGSRTQKQEPVLPALETIFATPVIQSLLKTSGSAPVIADFLAENGQTYGQFLNLWSASGADRELQAFAKANALSWLPQEIRTSVYSILFYPNGLFRGLRVRPTPEFVAFARKHGLDFMRVLGMDTLELAPGFTHYSDSDLSPDYAEIFRSLRNAAWLKRLFLSEHRMIDSAAVHALGKIPALENLQLHFYFQPEWASFAELLLPAVAKLKTLKSLMLSGVTLTGQLPILKPLSHLRELWINNRGEPLLISDLNTFSHFRELTHLILTNVRIDAPPSVPVNLPALTHFAIRTSRILPGLLVALTKESPLTHLDFAANRELDGSLYSGDELELGNLVAFLRARKKPVTHLNLQSNSLNLQDLKPLSSLQSLTHLALGHNGDFSVPASQAFRSASKLLRKLPQLQALELVGDFNMDAAQSALASYATECWKWDLGAGDQFNNAKYPYFDPNVGVMRHFSFY